MSKATEAVTEQETIKGVIEEVKASSLQAIMDLPALRKKNATPFTIPGTDIVVMVAPSTQLDVYKNIVLSMKAMHAEDEEEQIDAMRRTANSMLMSCIVEPELDEAAIEALNSASAVGVKALIEECQRVSGMADLDTGGMEDFS